VTNTEAVYCARSLQVRVPMTTVLPRAKRSRDGDPGSGLGDGQEPSGGPGPVGRELPHSTASASARLGAGSGALQAEQLQGAAQGWRDASAGEEESDEDTEALGEVLSASAHQSRTVRRLILA